MSIRSVVRVVVVALVVIAGLATVAPIASAHGSGTILVPHQLPGRPAPTLDAQCDPDYRRGYNGGRLLYQPAYDFGAPTFSLFETETDLWVCVTNLSRRPDGSTTQPYLSLVFDPDHSASAAPDTGDLALAIGEDGHLTEYHGNGVGFVPQATHAGWSAVTDTGTEIQWNAEYRISLSKIGNPGPNSVVGFQIRHNALFSTNDYFAWPSDSTRNAPPTWGDLFFLAGTAAPPGTVALAGGRITQGLDWDVAQGANRPYDFVAGKDAMVEGRLWTSGAIADLVYASCGVQEVWPTAGSVQSLPTDPSVHPRVFGTVASALGSTGSLRCWVPGALLREPGIYRFTVTGQMSGGTRQTLDVGMRTTMPARAVRLLIYRWIFPTGHPENRAWDSTLNASAMDAMRDLQRVLPVPAGVGGLYLGSTPPPTAAGLRYTFSPTVYQCLRGSGETIDEASSRCDATTRNNADLQRMTYDDQSARADRADGAHRDRIDLQEVYAATPQSGGGQSCWSNSASAGSGLDSLPTGISHFVPIQESQHCWGQVRPTSPHSIPDNTSHSLNDYFAPATGQPLINVQTRQEIPRPRGVMSPNFYPGLDEHTSFTNEGVEFNNLRSTLLGLAPPSGNAARGVAAAAGTRQFQIAFLMDHTTSPDGITLQTSKLLTGSTLAPTKPDPRSSYSLVFRDGDGSVLRRLPFGVTTEGTHDGPIPIEGQVLVANLPATATSVSIELKDTATPLYEQKFSAQAPTVSGLSAVPNGSNEIDLSWQGTDPDSTDLRYSVYFQQHLGGLKTLVANGLTDPSYAFDTSFAPGTANGVITVEASDGLNTGAATVGKVVVVDKKPDVLISAPAADATLLAGAPVHVSGAGYDENAMSDLDGKNLSWQLDGATNLGSGSELDVADLAVGSHSLRLTATTPAGTSASRTIKFTILADSDQDGVPNTVEIANPCLKVKVFDSADDPDSDGLSNYAEWQHGTDPCSPDSDKDGTGDGDEVEHGSDPTTNKSVPPAAKIYVPTESVDLGSCANPKPADLPVDQLKASPWTASSDEPYVSVSAPGSGSGFVHVTPDCTNLAPGYTYDAHVGIEATTGQFREVDVSFTA